MQRLPIRRLCGICQVCPRAESSLSSRDATMTENRLKRVFSSCQRSSSADILGMDGYLNDGRIHAHIVLADRTEAFGGHLALGTNVYTFSTVTLRPFMDGIAVSRVHDKTLR